MYSNAYIATLRKELPEFTVKKVPNERSWRVADRDGWWFLEFGEGAGWPVDVMPCGKQQAVKDAKRISLRYGHYKSKGTWL